MLRAALKILLSATLLIPLISGCDQAAVESGPGAHTDIDLADKRQSFTATNIIVPPPPRQLDFEGEWRYVPVRRFNSPRHEMEPAGRWLKRLENAATWDDATLLAANAAQAIGHMPIGAQRQFFPRLTQTMTGLYPLKDLVDRPPKPTRQEIFDFVGEDYAGVATICFVGFDDPDALNNIPDEANNTFAYDPFYRQNCDVADVRVVPTVYNHVHLNFEDTSIDCVDTSHPNWAYGREVDGECQAIEDHAEEDRLLATHTGAGIVRITATELFIGTPRTFDLISFINTSDVPVKLRYKTESGDWYQFNSLGGPTNWGVSLYDIVEVLITHEGTSLDCGIDQEAGAPGGCETAAARFFIDEFVIGL